MKNAISKTLIASTLMFTSATAIAMGDQPTAPVSEDNYAHLIDTPLNLGEQFTLRTYTGQAIGLALTNQLGIQRLAIVQNTSSICTSLAASIGGEAVAHNRDNNVYLSVAVDSVVAVEANKSQFLQKDAVALVFGGQTPMEQNYDMVKATLKTLAEANYEGELFYHVAVWMPKMLEKVAAEDAQIKAYLTEKANMFAVTIDPKEAKMLIHQVALEQDGTQASKQVVHEVAMNDSWLNLFKRSLIKRN